ncbi:MAG: cell division protein FtsZ [Bacteroidales bacterium]|nr:cell division protein FtsZ [Bacteroidales bacterium]
MENNGFDITTAIPAESRKAASIKIIGVGGGGGNAANRMYNEGIQDVDFIICNSDKMDLDKSPIPTKIRLGEGRGCGSNAEKGQEYAKECTAQIQAELENTQMVFITAGMGGGTGTGAAPVIAEISQNMGILTVAIVTMPYKFEGSRRMRNAMAGIEELRKHVDSILIINNQTLREQYGALTMTESFEKADGILAVAARSIAEIMQKTGFINVDFEDVRAVMKDSGVAVMASGTASGSERAFEAIERTLDSPLLNKADIRGAKKILLNITSSEENELTGDELEVIMEYIRQKAETDVDITWGYMKDKPEDGSELQITLIATGFEIEDIPDFQKPVEKKVIVVNSTQPEIIATPKQEQPTSGTQGDLFSETPSFSTTQGIDDLKNLDNDDIFENIISTPAYLRRDADLKTSDVKSEISKSRET